MSQPTIAYQPDVDFSVTAHDLYRFIASKRYGVLATVSPEGGPECALVGIAVTEDLELVFDTLNDSRKYHNLVANQRAAFCIGWDDEVTLQYDGEARKLAGEELERFQAVYFAKWPECRAHLKWPGIAYFAVRPRWIRFSDYGKSAPEVSEFIF